MISENNEVVPLAEYSEEQLARLLPYKIYDALPWEIERPLMLEKWRNFVRDAQPDTTYVFNCVLLQNPMCETMMRFGFSESESQYYIEEIAKIIASMNPLVIYLKNDDITESVRKAAAERPGWMDAVIDYHVNGAYGKSIGAHGFDGYVRCLKERQQRELRILAALPVDKWILDNPQKDWKMAKKNIKAVLMG